jgi:hypothetical protein
VPHRADGTAGRPLGVGCARRREISRRSPVWAGKLSPELAVRHVKRVQAPPPGASRREAISSSSRSAR